MIDNVPLIALENWLNNFGGIPVNHIYRGQNSVADIFAKMALQNDSCWNEYAAPPLHKWGTLQADSIGATWHRRVAQKNLCEKTNRSSGPHPFDKQKKKHLHFVTKKQE